SNVRGNVTVHLVDVPLKSALDEILKAEGFGYVQEDGLIRVVPLNEIEIMKPKEKSLEVVKEPEPEKISEFFELKYAVASDIQQVIEKLLDDKGTVLTDRRTNSLIVIATEKEIQKAREAIQRLDKKVTDENVIEIVSGKPVKTEEVVVEKIVKRVFKLNYISPEKAVAIITPLLSEQGMALAIESEEEKNQQSEGSSGSSGSMGISGGAGTGIKLDEAVGQGGYIVVSDIESSMVKIEKEIKNVDVPVPQVEIEAYIVEGLLTDDNDMGIDWTAVSKEDDISISFSGDYGGIIAKGIIPVEKFTGILDVLNTSSDLKVLSNPSITTVEDHPAIFHSGDRIPYSKTFIQDGIQQVDTVFEEVGIVLAATPYVKEDNMISLVLSTSVSSEGGFTPSGQPRITTKTTRNQVLVKSGDTVAIAGLISEKTSDVVSKVPIVGDIPLIGKVFSTQRETNQRSEVTIFITPRIVSNVYAGSNKN
ncbi:hypothetical protein GF312_15465, partial [Candidatus Poribacteria bacterium]|nr:hypothetical protein [Candidatus Poribacteria bacterium]